MIAYLLDGLPFSIMEDSGSDLSREIACRLTTGNAAKVPAAAKGAEPSAAAAQLDDLTRLKVASEGGRSESVHQTPRGPERFARRCAPWLCLAGSV